MNIKSLPLSNSSVICITYRNKYLTVTQEFTNSPKMTLQVSTRRFSLLETLVSFIFKFIVLCNSCIYVQFIGGVRMCCRSKTDVGAPSYLSTPSSCMPTCNFHRSYDIVLNNLKCWMRNVRKSWKRWITASVPRTSCREVGVNGSEFRIKSHLFSRTWAWTQLVLERVSLNCSNQNWKKVLWIAWLHFDPINVLENFGWSSPQTPNCETSEDNHLRYYQTTKFATSPIIFP